MERVSNFMKRNLLKGLSEEQIAEAVSGGCGTYTVRCPKCGSNIIVENCDGKKDYYCNNCGHEFNDNLWEDIKNLVD